MNNLNLENNEDVNIGYNASDLNDTHKTKKDDLKENRKFMLFVLRNLTQKKNYSYDLQKRDCLEMLRNSNRDLTKITDEEKNTC